MTLDFIVLRDKYSIYKFKNKAALPDWIYSSDFYSITKTIDELSVIAIQTEVVSEDFVSNNDWRILKISGLLDFSLVGILADVACTFKEKNIPIFTISTYNTDHILVKQQDLSIGLKALRDKGHKISIEN
jgi:uncharacterized protein